jgi:hypothetical protein
MAAVLLALATDIAVVVGLLWVTRKARRLWVPRLCAFVISVAGACSLGLATVTILMHAAGFFNEELWLVLVWLIPGLMGLAAAGSLGSPFWLIASPCYLIALASLAYAAFVGEVLCGAMSFAILIAALLTIYGARKWSMDAVPPRPDPWDPTRAKRPDRTNEICRNAHVRA